MTLTVEDSILRLKAEIIAQDWRLSPKRAAQLDAAFTCLRERFQANKATHAMLVMAANVLNYIKNRGASPPETIDFLKEAMAHVVNLYEDLADDPARAEELFQGLFARFTTLKEKIRQQSAGAADTSPPRQAEPEPAPELSTSGAEGGGRSPALVDLQQRIAEFKNGVAAAGAIGVAFSKLLDEWLLSPAVVALLQVEEGDPAHGPDSNRSAPAPPEQTLRCPPTFVKVLTLGGLTVAIPSSVIALVRPIPSAKATVYLQDATVPLHDFSRVLQRLGRQFSGSLALVKERTLKELRLPIMTPQGHEFPEAPPQKFDTLVVISNGNWHGALACDELRAADRIMIQFAKQPNGDLAGIAYLEDGGQIPLLDPLAMLQREGILLLR